MSKVTSKIKIKFLKDNSMDVKIEDVTSNQMLNAIIDLTDLASKKFPSPDIAKMAVCRTILEDAGIPIENFVSNEEKELKNDN